MRASTENTVCISVSSIADNGAGSPQAVPLGPATTQPRVIGGGGSTSGHVSLTPQTILTVLTQTPAHGSRKARGP